MQGFETLVFGSGDQDGIRRPGLLEEAGIVRKNNARKRSRTCRPALSDAAIGPHHADGLQPFGMTHGIFEVFVGPVSAPMVTMVTGRFKKEVSSMVCL